MFNNDSGSNVRGYAVASLRRLSAARQEAFADKSLRRRFR
jgi:hypothetical protein